jgi:hypothetical protein
MAIDPLYIPLWSLEEVILDKDTGLPLSGGIVSFYRDSQRTDPKDIYQISGSSPDYSFTDVGSVFTLGISGTFVDINGNPFVPYAYPYDAEGNVDLYYITVVNSGGVAQFTRQAVPYIPSAVIPPADLTNSENQLCNPQFVEVSFTGTTVITVTGTNTVSPIAPGWDIISTGSGTITVQQLQPTSASIITNPPYTLSIAASSGLGSSIILRQRLNNSPSYERGNYISATFTVAVLSGGSSAISMLYVPSTGTSTTLIPSVNVSTDGTYNTYFGNAMLVEQANTAAATGYVDIQIVLPTSRTLAFTSLQIVGLTYSADIPFNEQSADRQKDHLFHYYENAAVHQPKANLLTGWNFALNPWQFRTTSSTNLATNAYTADQTIVIQQAYVDSATGNNIAVGQSTYTQNYGFNIVAVTAANKFVMLQYIDTATIAQFWGRTLSVMLKASLISTNGTVPQFKVRLIYNASLPATTSQSVPIASWTNVDQSLPALSSGWSYITALNDPTYTLTTTSQDFAFNQFVLPASTSDTMTLGIMIIMMNNLTSTGTADQLLFNEVSLVHSDFAVKADPETYDQTLRKCQYYYETSYDYGYLPGTSTVLGYISRNMTVTQGTGACYAAAWQIQYNTVKRAIPTTTIYSYDGTVNDVYVQTYVNGSISTSANKVVASFWNVGGSSTKAKTYIPSVSSPGALVTVASADNLACSIVCQFTADARLGT